MRASRAHSHTGSRPGADRRAGATHRVGGGDELALARHAVAALLNARDPDVNFIFDEEGLKALVASGDPELAERVVTSTNGFSCPL